MGLKSVDECITDTTLPSCTVSQLKELNCFGQTNDSYQLFYTRNNSRICVAKKGTTVIKINHVNYILF